MRRLLGEFAGGAEQLDRHEFGAFYRFPHSTWGWSLRLLRRHQGNSLLDVSMYSDHTRNRIQLTRDPLGTVRTTHIFDIDCGCIRRRRLG